MSDKPKEESLRLRARRAAFARLNHRHEIDIVIRERIVKGEQHL